jgi:hypothetical protein
VVSKNAKESLKAAQRRYKREYRNAKLEVDDWVFVKVFTESPMFTLPLVGPSEFV